MARNKLGLGIFCSLFFLMTVGSLSLYGLRHVIWGQSIPFYLDTGLRVPNDAQIIADKEHYPLPDSSEGERLLVFDVKPEQTVAFLASSPKMQTGWHRGPVPKTITQNLWSPISSPYVAIRESPRVWYSAQSTAANYWDGKLLVVDPVTNRVFLFNWNM